MKIKLSKLQYETMQFLRTKLDEGSKNELYTQGEKCTIRTLRSLEKIGLIEVIEDNSGIGICGGAFPSKVRVIDPDFKMENFEIKNKTTKEKPKTKYIERNGFNLIVDEDGNILTDEKLLYIIRNFIFKNSKDIGILITKKAQVSLSTYKPLSKEEFIKLDGLGEKIYDRCGTKLISLIESYLEHENDIKTIELCG